MSNPLLDLVYRWRSERQRPSPAPVELPEDMASSGGVFLVLRRMRRPLIVLVAVFAISVLGFTLIPGHNPAGSADRMSFFDAFYFVSYTATTIGFGELPHEFSQAQRIWVTLMIYMGVIGWAYAIGTILSLVQDTGFRQALERQRFARSVKRIPEPFLLLVGYGDAGRIIVKALDDAGQRVVVVERTPDRVQALELEALRFDVPALRADARNPANLMLAGLGLGRCHAVLAMTDDDQTNLAVVQAVNLLSPELPVVARVSRPSVARQMRSFGHPTLIDPFDAFGDELRILLRAPVTAQLRAWLASPPGAPLGPRPAPPHTGAWVVLGDEQLVHDVADDLRADDLPVTLLRPSFESRGDSVAPDDPRFAELARGAVGLVAAAEQDVLNLSFVAAARAANPDIFVIVRQEARADASLFRALGPDLLLMPAQEAAREVFERLSDPQLWAFAEAGRALGDAWAEQLLDRLVAECGTGSPLVWSAAITREDAPALARRIEEEPVLLGDLLSGRWSALRGVVVLSLVRAGQRILTPGPETELSFGDVLLLASRPQARRGWYATVDDDATLSMALTGVAEPATWWGRLLLRNYTARRVGV